jgi:glucose-6-phosphate 1-dehydrogenase
MGLRTKIYGYDREFEESNLSLAGTDAPEAYEQVLIDAIRGDRALFLARSEILESWRIIDAAFSKKHSLKKYQPETDYDKV